MSPDPSRHVPLRQPTAFPGPVRLPPHMQPIGRPVFWPSPPCPFAPGNIIPWTRPSHSLRTAIPATPADGGGGGSLDEHQPPPTPPPRSSGISDAIWQIFWLHNSKRAKTYRHILANFVQKGQKWGRASEKLGFLLLLFLILCTSKKYLIFARHLDTKNTNFHPPKCLQKVKFSSGQDFFF
jgi:hypothetical protein